MKSTVHVCQCFQLGRATSSWSSAAAVPCRGAAPYFPPVRETWAVRSVAVTGACNMIQHHLPSSAIEDWLAPARRLQGCPDQPPLHELRKEDFRAHETAGATNVHDQYIPIGQGHRPIGSPIIDSTDERTGLTAISASGRPDNDVLLTMLQSIASGTGLTVLRLSDSCQRHDILARCTPHELALTARGLSLQLGVQSALQRNQLQHLTQRQKERECSTKPTGCNSWVQVGDIDVTLVTCLQDCKSDGCDSGLDPTTTHNVQAGRRQQGYRIWAMPAAELLAEVTSIVGPQVAERLFEAKYCVANQVGTDKDVHWQPPSQSAGPSPREDRRDPGEQELTAVLWLTTHRGRPRAWDSRGKPRAYDSRDSRDQSRCRVVPDPLALRGCGGPEHDMALATLQQILLKAPEADGQNDSSSYQHARWRLVELHTGDIMIADNNILLRHTAFSSDWDSTSDWQSPVVAPASHAETTGLVCDTAGGAANNDAFGAVVYDEVEVLRSCAESRRQCFDGPESRSYRSSNHALWMALRRDHQPLKWWWW